MNIKDITDNEKAVTTKVLFRSEQARATAIQILEGQILKQHVSNVPALLMCILGKVVFEDEKGMKETLGPGDYLHITPMIKHWVNAVIDSQLVLFK